MTLIPLAVELTKTADIQDLGFSQAFETIYTILENLKKEEDKKAEVSSPLMEVVPVKKKRRRRRVACVVCGEKFIRITPKHLKKHGITLAEYQKLESLPVNRNGAVLHDKV